MSKASPDKRPNAERVTLTPGDWEQAALELIADQGLSALGVEPLARRLGITKGSFYWHFSGRDDLLERALARWENQDRYHLQQSLTSGSRPAERLAEFVWRTSRQTLTHRIYVALCAMPNDERIGPVIKRVTARRIKYLTAAFAELGLSPESAGHRANLVYSSYVGYLHLQAQGLVPDKDDPAFEHYVGHVIETLVDLDHPSPSSDEA
ncbi:TetR/AcrR family transcriptional regulator [Wenzhouxiangella marina]|uniref:TetR family transcriptional regulator n=1 Tax=Wenzhouxiangella marina TaxID=1579979 RepID=A0A0K0XYX6_9GAMM|nr:TetR/AcrR family transcriptional regulator [Wenzhouxiangella marina]AKS42893.1 TetR family transcriptional regulator [Wenzhouxiangella marina]MBB6087424.1 AcrR family transcriptional regulator [Wenzhouxiangella marina]